MSMSVKKSLGVPYSDIPCRANEIWNHDNQFLQYYGCSNYIYGSCGFDCVYKFSVQPCSCDLSKGNNECSMLQYIDCILPKLNEYYAHNHSSKCECFPMCTETFYDYQMSALKYANRSTLLIHQVGNMTVKDLRKNISLFIYFDSIEYEAMEQVPSKTLGKLIADTGGQMGLFLGASIMTIFEILELLYLIL